MPAAIVLPCSNLDASLSFLVDRYGFRVDRVLPADAPEDVTVSRDGLSVRLVSAERARQEGLHEPLPAALQLCGDGLSPGRAFGPDGLVVEVRPPATDVIALPPLDSRWQLVRNSEASGGWHVGRAGMLYRDLIPSRLGGRFIASHIRIPLGGPVPDYVHYHRVRMQLIYVRRGWVKVVYEDQGEPFVMEEGDLVLQVPTIRHRVLASSPGLEVIELGSPAVHETLADHALALPTPEQRPERLFGGQRFVWHRAAEAAWSRDGTASRESCELGVRAASQGLVSATSYRAGRDGDPGEIETAAAELEFLFVLDGQLLLHPVDGVAIALAADDAVCLPAGQRYRLAAGAAARWLALRLPG